jgi:hypothetical protein
MNERATPGITFRETLSGPFHLGAVDPADGRHQGESARTRLTVRLAVTIPDVRRFLQERAAAGEITGTIDFEPLGRDLPIARGAFNVEPPAGRARHHVVTYDLAFRSGGTAYFLAGGKQVDVPGVDPRAGMTTLLATLHEGTDRRGVIVGAGVLTLEPGGLERLMESIRATDAPSLGERTLALTAFGRAFMGSLWESRERPPSRARALWGRLVRRSRRG